MATDAEVRAWLAANPTATDAQIAAAMQQAKVEPAQVARVTGLDPATVQARYEAATTPEIRTVQGLGAASDIAQFQAASREAQNAAIARTVANATEDDRARVAKLMDMYGVNPAQMAEATGYDPKAVQKIYNEVNPAGTNVAPTSLNKSTNAVTVGNQTYVFDTKQAADKFIADNPGARAGAGAGAGAGAVTPSGTSFAATRAPTNFTAAGQFIPRSVDVATPIATRTPYANAPAITPYAGPSLLSMPQARPTLDRLFQVMGGERTGERGTYTAPEMMSQGYTPDVPNVTPYSYITPRPTAPGTTPAGTTPTPYELSTDPLINAWRNFQAGTGSREDVQRIIDRSGRSLDQLVSQYNLSPQDRANLQSLGFNFSAGASAQPDALADAWRAFQAGTGSREALQQQINASGMNLDQIAGKYGFSPADYTNVSSLGFTYPSGTIPMGDAGEGAAAGNFGTSHSFGQAMSDIGSTIMGVLDGSFSGSPIGNAPAVGAEAAPSPSIGFGGGFSEGDGIAYAEGGEVTPMRAFTPRELGSTFEAPDYQQLFDYRRDVVFNPELQAAEERELARLFGRKGLQELARYQSGGVASTAQNLAGMGRGGDSVMVHMTPQEVRGLQALAESEGTSLTINPYTGMPEAFNLRKLLKKVAKVGQFVLPFIPGIGLPAKVALSAVAGGLGGNKKGFDFKRGLASGMMAFGAGKIGEGLAAAGRIGTPVEPGMTQIMDSPAFGGSGFAGASSAPTASLGGIGQQASDIFSGGKALLGRDPAAIDAFNQAASTNILGKEFGPLTSARAGLMGLSGIGAADEQSKMAAEIAAQTGEREERLRRYRDEAARNLGAIPFAGGGDVMAYEAGGTTGPTHTPRMVTGTGDGMSDNVPASIEGVQEARLADGEFVIPADVVADIGNGSSSAGARKLYQMMDRIRSARHGTTKQPPEVNTAQLMPV